MKRSGLITKKVGMTRMYDEAGRAHSITVLSVGDCTVVGNRTMDKNGYVAVVLGYMGAKEKHVAKPQLVAAQKAGVRAYRKLSEFRVSEDCLIPVGTELSAGHFVAGQFLDVQATSKGKGFAGGMKRWNNSGLEASHGVLKAHRSLGSTGNREWPARVFKGHHMAGQMGNETVSVQNLKLFGIDENDNLLFVEGAVPGANGSFVMVSDAVKKIPSVELPVPTRLASAPVAVETVVEPAEEVKEEVASEGQGE
ncbi:MAG: 50S ribosomal protein L3 [Rickettsiales bacterium]|jgi:large subunit ribosomal protein L3|nr:50S ribosomal protein L3 [Rickettsiales bacterium]